MTPGDDLERLKAAAPEAAELLRQLANANRLLILCHIAQEERSVGQLEQELGLRQPPNANSQVAAAFEPAEVGMGIGRVLHRGSLVGMK